MENIRSFMKDDEDRVTEEIGRMVARLYRKQLEIIGNSIKKLGISSLHSVFLVNIFRYPGLNQNQLAEIICIDRATVSRILRFLELQDYIYKELNEEDRRFYKLYLTDRGIDIVNKSLSIQCELWNEILKDISSEDRHKIMELLYTMFHNLEQR